MMSSPTAAPTSSPPPKIRRVSRKGALASDRCIQIKYLVSFVLYALPDLDEV